MRLYRPVRPGTFRMALAALTITVLVAAVLKWETADWWWVGAAAVVLVVLLGSWRGIHVTAIAWRRVAILVGHRRPPRANGWPADVRTTVLLRIGPPSPGIADEFPLRTVAGYLNRYGIRCKAIRITSRYPAGGTWIGLTVSAADNLAALRARSPEVPLWETATVMRRRLADQLHELGWTVEQVDRADCPLPDRPVKERWRGVQTERGFVAAYRVDVTDELPGRLARLQAPPTLETWTVLEITGDPARPALSAACAVRTADRPSGKAPVPGVIPQAGRHRLALTAMSPVCTEFLGGPATRVSGSFLEALRWSAGAGCADLEPLHGADPSRAATQRGG